MAGMSCCSTVPSRRGAELEGGSEVGVKRSHHFEDVSKVAQGERRDVEMLWFIDTRCVQRMNGDGAQQREVARRRHGHRLAAR